MHSYSKALKSLVHLSRRCIEITLLSCEEIHWLFDTTQQPEIGSKTFAWGYGLQKNNHQRLFEVLFVVVELQSL